MLRCQRNTLPIPIPTSSPPKNPSCIFIEKKYILIDRILIITNYIYQTPLANEEIESHLSLKNMGKNDKLTLAKAFERIDKQLENSELSNKKMAAVSLEIEYVCHKLNVSLDQCFILAALMHKIGKNLDTFELASYAGVSMLRILGMQKDIDNLIERGMVICLKDPDPFHFEQTLTLSDSMIESLRYNKKSTKRDHKSITPLQFMNSMETLLHDCDYSEIEYSVMVAKMNVIFEKTQHLHLTSRLTQLNLNEAELVFLLIAIVALVNKRECTISSIDYSDILPSVCRLQIERGFRQKKGRLCELGLMEEDEEEEYALTTEAVDELLTDYGVPPIEKKVEKKTKETKETEEKGAPEKVLFYNKQETMQIERLRQLLDREKFKEVQQRMARAGMRPGFACLFYGSPGTGKTETVIQLARQTGREIVQVNISTLRNMYVGESEKNVQKVFDDYRRKMEQSDITPILLFNEADAIFGVRYKNVNDSVDQMENTIQNIILQNLETFEGILIATTNLTDNFDKAFERRFLYKVEFKKPTAEVRKMIWMSMMPELNENDAETLAVRYDFSGGQIENVARKQIVESILNGTTLDISTLKMLCEEERISKGAKGSVKQLSA